MAMPDRIRGVIPAMFTPYDKNGEVNPSVIPELIDFHLRSGVAGFFVCGSTGEGLLQSPEERQLVAETAVKAVNGRVPVIVHVGANATRDSVRLARHAAEIGADAVASIPPAGQDMQSIIEHYLLIGEASPLPLYVYASTVSDPVGLMRRLIAEAPTLRGIKFTTSDLFRLNLIVQLENGFLNVLSGADEMALGALAMGADGIIGSTYNALPGAFVGIYNAVQRGDVVEARRLQSIANRILEVLTRGPVIPRTKELLRMLGIDTGDARRPYRPLSDAERKQLREDVLAAGLREIAEVKA